MTIEEITYDFTGHKEYLHNFFVKIVRLMIISKLNCLESNSTSKNYFYEMVKRIDGCETHKIKYGKSMIFTKYLGYEFNFHTIRSTIKIIDQYNISIRLESIFFDFVKIFDKLSSDVQNIKWNVPLPTVTTTTTPATTTTLDKNSEKEISKDNKGTSITDSKKSTSHSDNSSNFKNTDKDEKKIESTIIQKDIDKSFELLDLFIEALFFLTTLDCNNPNSLLRKTIEIKDVTIIRKSMALEILIDGKTIIMNLITKTGRNNQIVIILDNEEKTGKTLKEIMLQNKY